MVTGALLAITIIGIPLAIGNFKQIPIALAPFGREIVRDDLPPHAAPAAY